MGSNSTFFFSPAAEDQINPLFDEEVFQITAELSESLYDVFDGLGQLSVSQEFFPNYYLGYGSSYPSLLGAVPFLFEQGSARGMVQDTDNGLKRYDQTILEQFQAAVALLGEAAEQREDRSHKTQHSCQGRAGFGQNTRQQRAQVGHMAFAGTQQISQLCGR